MFGSRLQCVTFQICRLAAVTAVAFLPAVAPAQAPTLNGLHMHRGRVLNEVHFQFVPENYVNMSGALNGAQIYSVSPMTNGVASETAPIGDRYSDRRLTGAWSGSFGNFRFTRQPDGGPPFNQAAGILMTPPQGTNQLRVVTRDLHDYNAAYPHTRLTLYANGVYQGAVTVSTPSGSGIPVDFPLNLNGADTFSARVVGPGTVTVNQVYLYRSNDASTPISWGFPNVVATGNGSAVWFKPDFYGGPASDMALRITASGVNGSSRLIIANQAGKVALDTPLTAGAGVVTTEDPDPLRRVGDVTRSYTAGTVPPVHESRVVWGDDMKIVGPQWTKLSGGMTLYSNGSSVVIQGSPSQGAVAARVALPSASAYNQFRYLHVRVRASEKTNYFIRPFLGDVQAHTTAHVTALEARPGQMSATDGGWETITFNLKTLGDLYGTAARSVDRFDFVLSPQPGNTASAITMEIDWMALSSGIPADSLSTSEENFANSLDDDGDGQIDRDDPDFRVQFPVSVYVNYQTVIRRLGLPGFSGTRAPAPGQSGPTYNIDANQFSPNNPTKRLVALTYYPLDYVANPNYEAPGNWNEFFDKNQDGNWSPCGSVFAPPTEQFPGLNYQTLGSVEEYNVTDPNWMRAQAALARKHSLDGFIYNDGGIKTDEQYVDGMREVLDAQAAGTWKNDPFRLASFYQTVGNPNSTEQTASSVLKDMLYILKKRGMQALSGITFRGKPVIFIYPTSAGSLGSTIDEAEWGQIFDGLRRPDAENFDGAFNGSTAQAAANNVLQLKFNRYRDTINGGWSGSLDMVEWLDTNLAVVGETDIGTPAQRGALVDGWWSMDTSSGPDEGYTEMMSAGTPGQARLNTTVPPNAVYMRLRMRAWGAGPEVGGVQQVCELRLNTTGGTAAASFNARAGWNTYLFRLRSLPAGFTTAGQGVQTLAELPVSFWGAMPNLVARTDEGYNRTKGFDGFANYNSNFQDARVEVSYPHLRAATVRPGLDHGGYLYSCNGLNHFHMPYNNGATYRGEWEKAIRMGADMVIITSWNEYAEATNIEPDIERGFNPLRITQTYSLLYKGTLQTGKMPAATNLLVNRFDIEGSRRIIDFSLNGPDTLRFNNVGFGYGASGIVSITRNGSPVALGSAEARWEGAVERPTLVINAPAGSNRYVITYNNASEVTTVRHSTLQPGQGGTAPPEWQSLGSTNPGMATLSYDAGNSALRAHVTVAANTLRSTGYYTASTTEWLPYSAIGAGNYARARFHVYSGGQSNPAALNQIPNMRLRVANRFSVTSMLEVFNHSNGDPGNDQLASELRPSGNPAKPSVYRVDMDPIDIPYLQANANAEGLMRGFEVFSSDPQDNGYIALTESTIGVYPAALTPDSASPVKLYVPRNGGAGDLAGGSVVIQNVIPQPNGAPAVVTDDPAHLKGTYREGAFGVTLDTSQVPTDRVGFVAKDFNPGSDPAAPDYVRVEEGKQYKVRFHLTSTQNVTANAQIRLRVRSAKFAWVQKLEIGGSWATGSVAGSTIAQQSLPGVGSGNPGGWYNVLFHTPMNVELRAEMSGPLSARMPNLSREPGPGSSLGSRRDLKLGLDLLDSISGGAQRPLEKGNVTCDRIEVRAYPLVAD